MRIPDSWLRDRDGGLSPTAEEIRSLRRRSGATLDEIAVLLHVGKRTYQDWEAGRTRMHPHHWLAMRLVCQRARPRITAAPSTARRRTRARR